MLIHSKQIEDTFDFRQGQYYVRLDIYLCTWSAWRVVRWKFGDIGQRLRHIFLDHILYR